MSTEIKRLSDLLVWFIPSWFVGYLAVGAALVQLQLSWPQIVSAVLIGAAFSVGLNILASNLAGRTGASPNFGSFQSLIVGAWTILLTGFVVGYGSLMGGSLLESLDWSNATIGALLCLTLTLCVSALLVFSDEEFRAWMRIAFGVLMLVFVAALLYGANSAPEPLDHGSIEQLLLGVGLVFVTSSVWLQSVISTRSSECETTRSWAKPLGGVAGTIVFMSMGAAIASTSSVSANQMVDNPMIVLSNLTTSPFLVPALAVCVIAQIAFSSANVTVIEQTLSRFGRIRGGKWISLILIALLSLATIFGQGLMEQILMQAAIVFAAFVGVLIVSLLLPSRSNTLAYAAFLIGAGAGVAVTVFWESLLNMTWIIGIITAATVGALGAVINRFVVGPKKQSTPASSDEDDAAQDSEPDLSPGDLLAARIDVPEDIVEEAIDELVAPQPARGINADEDADIENWVEDSNRGLSGVFRTEKFDETQKQLANQPRPSRAMSQDEQDELEALLTDTGTLSIYVDDGSDDSPARPRRALPVEEQVADED